MLLKCCSHNSSRCCADNLKDTIHSSPITVSTLLIIFDGLVNWYTVVREHRLIACLNIFISGKTKPRAEIKVSKKIGWRLEQNFFGFIQSGVWRTFARNVIYVFSPRWFTTFSSFGPFYITSLFLFFSERWCEDRLSQVGPVWYVTVVLFGILMCFFSLLLILSIDWGLVWLLHTWN